MGTQPLIIGVAADPRLRTHPAIWRALEFAERIFAAVLLLIAFPFLAAVAFVTVALSVQSPLVAHRRVGRKGQTFWVVKLRTMWDRRASVGSRLTIVERVASGGGGVITIKSRSDPRVTSRFAALCRRYSIDEAPQLWHVVRGEMALVGPRPLTVEELEVHYGSVVEELLSVRPGLTGLWQVSGRSRLSYLQRRRLDLFLIRNWSPDLYAKILIRTIPAVLVGTDAW